MNDFWMSLILVWYWILRCGGAASPVWREPPVRTNGATPFSVVISYFAIAGSNPYTSRIERSLDGSMLSISILYESYVIRSIMASARVLSSPQICWYHSLSRNCEQKIVDDFLRLLCISSKRFLASASVSLRRSHSSMISTTGLVCLRNQVPVFSQNKYLPASSSHADHFFYFIFLATKL